MDDRISPEVLIGKIGEHLVCADIMKQGYSAFLADKGCYYDVIAEIDGRLMRIQVKTTRKKMKMPQRKNFYERYQFWVRRYGKGGRKAYEKRDIDLLALVAIDKNIVAYRKPELVKQCMFYTEDMLSGMNLSKSI